MAKVIFILILSKLFFKKTGENVHIISFYLLFMQ